MKFLFKWTIRLVILAILLVVAIFLFRNEIMRGVMERRIQKATGLETHIGRVQVHFSTASVWIENLRIYNTAEYGGSPLIDLPDFYMELDRDLARDRKLALKLFRINLAEVNVVRGTNGLSNFDALKARFDQQKEKSDAKVMEFAGIQTLNLTIGKIRYTDMTRPDQPQEMNLGFKNEIIPNIKSEADFKQGLMTLMLRKGMNLFSLLGLGAPTPAPVPAPPQPKPAPKKTRVDEARAPGR